MDVLNYLEDNNAQIAQHLTETAKNYWQSTHDRTFEEVKQEFQSIEDHFSREALLINNIEQREKVKNLLNEITKQKAEIRSEIEQIVEIHVDELGFEHALRCIANKFSQYALYCANTLSKA